MRLTERYPSFPYVAPFATFMVLLVLGPRLPIPARVEALLRVAVVTAVLLLCSRSVISLQVRHWATSIALGIGVFALWITPDVLFPDFRSSWLFTNGLTGKVEGTVPEDVRHDTLVLSLRFARAAILVPIVEELFWRGWLQDRKSTRLNSSHSQISYAVFCLKKKKKQEYKTITATNIIISN